MNRFMTLYLATCCLINKHRPQITSGTSHCKEWAFYSNGWERVKPYRSYPYFVHGEVVYSHLSDRQLPIKSVHLDLSQIVSVALPADLHRSNCLKVRVFSFHIMDSPALIYSSCVTLPAMKIIVLIKFFRFWRIFHTSGYANAVTKQAK